MLQYFFNYGMMVIVAITRRSGVFQFIAIWSAKRVLARPWAIAGDALGGHRRVLGIVAFLFAHPLRLEPATIAMFGAALLLLITNIGRKAEAQSESVHRRFGEVE